MSFKYICGSEKATRKTINERMAQFVSQQIAPRNCSIWENIFQLIR
jgi:hypothetical protein